MAVNQYFAMTMYIQKNHQVCSWGAYHIIRHRGYLAKIIGIFCYGLILQSWWSFIPSIILYGIFVIRISLEDNTLKVKLDGYKEYAQKTRYRLIPYIW
jgi:protein-S-isoprenylcysteine O-methyltransferase Ste14